MLRLVLKHGPTEEYLNTRTATISPHLQDLLAKIWEWDNHLAPRLQTIGTARLATGHGRQEMDQEILGLLATLLLWYGRVSRNWDVVFIHQPGFGCVGTSRMTP